MRSFFSLFLISLIGASGIWFFSGNDTTYPLYTSRLNGVTSVHGSDWLYHIDASVTFESPRTALYFSFPRSSELLTSRVNVAWEKDGKNIERWLDTEDLDMAHYDTRIFSVPWIGQAQDTAHFRITSNIPLRPEDLILMSSYSEGPSHSVMNTAYAGTRIVSRAEWWADESYRYAESALQKWAFQEYLHFRQSPKTREQIESITTDTLRQEALDVLLPDTEKAISTKRAENGHRLVWPIEKTRQVNRIVIHHTAENIEETEASDEVFLKDIYKYHAITRGWGDIGYNYIIWQRGAIYEWRAWGDYVVWGHVHANNAGTVGISVIGNFQNIHLNRDQRAGLEAAISYVAEKYGITLSSDVTAIIPCKSGGVECREVKTHITKALVGHRDLDATDCPWINIYSEIPWLISKLDAPRKLIPNPENPSIDPIPPDEIQNMELKPPDSTVNQDTTILSTLFKKSPKSPIVKIKLSYSWSSMILEWATVSPPIARIWQRKIASNQKYRAIISLIGKNQVMIQSGNRVYTGSSFSLEWEVVRITSWERIPAWDMSHKYNDNLFRGKIVVRNEGGKFLIVNEIPIEDYLRWLGEVSNSDLPEKIKTIIVSARSYAYYYMDKTHRKYETLLYDGLDDPDSFQKYLGYGYEMRSPNVSRYVDETRGLVVKYEKEPIKVWYSSSTDGRTLSYLEYCKNSVSMNCMDIPYLQSTDDPGSVWKVRIWHWVGISWLWATYFATQGWDYQKIIQYYLKWVEISKK